jgi:spore maturation protein SpmA
MRARRRVVVMRATIIRMRAVRLSSSSPPSHILTPTILHSQYVHLQKEMAASWQYRRQGMKLGRGLGMHVEDEPELVGECFREGGR